MLEKYNASGAAFHNERVGGALFGWADCLTLCLYGMGFPFAAVVDRIPLFGFSHALLCGSRCIPIRTQEPYTPAQTRKQVAPTFSPMPNAVDRLA